MTSVVISEKFGGFGLSADASREYLRRTGRTWTEEPGFLGSINFIVAGEPDWYERDIPRDDSTLVAVVREMGASANSRFSSLAVVEVPNDAEWYVHE